MEVLRRLFDALPGGGLGRARRGERRARADLGTDVHDDQRPDAVGSLGGEVHRVPAAHREPDEDQRGQAELVDDAGDVVERRDRVVDVRRIAVSVTALVERVDVKVRLQREAEGVPGVRVPREPVQEQERRAIAATPVEDVKPQPVDPEMKVQWAQEVHRVC